MVVLRSPHLSMSEVIMSESNWGASPSCRYFPEHKVGLYLTHNEHKCYYQTVEQYSAECDRDDDWISPEQRQKAIRQDSVWVLQWYPDTPVGFYRLLACDLSELLAAATE